MNDTLTKRFMFLMSVLQVRGEKVGVEIDDETTVLIGDLMDKQASNFDIQDITLEVRELVDLLKSGVR